MKLFCSCASVVTVSQKNQLLNCRGQAVNAEDCTVSLSFITLKYIKEWNVMFLLTPFVRFGPPPVLTPWRLYGVSSSFSSFLNNHQHLFVSYPNFLIWHASTPAFYSWFINNLHPSAKTIKWLKKKKTLTISLFFSLTEIRKLNKHEIMIEGSS